MFFVISGYCLAQTVESAWNRDQRVGEYLQRRAWRILPPFWCSVGVVAAVPFAIEALSALKSGVYHWPEPSRNLAYLTYGFNDWLRVLTLTMVFDHGHALSAKFTGINAVYWTLAIEVQFYIVMAAAVWLGRRRGTYWLLGVTIVSAGTGPWQTTGVFLPYWPLFAVGVSLFVAIARGYTLRARWPALPAIVAWATVLWAIGGDNALWRWLLFALAFGVVLWALHPSDQRIPGLDTLGAMGYSIYLIHGRLYLLAEQVASQISRDSVLRDGLALTLTLAGCAAFYRLCEAPFVAIRAPYRATSQPHGAVAEV